MLNNLPRRIIAIISLIAFTIEPIIEAYSTSYLNNITNLYLSSDDESEKNDPTNKDTPTKLHTADKEDLPDLIKATQSIIRTQRELNDFLMKASPLKPQSDDVVVDYDSIKKLEILVGEARQTESLLNHLSTNEEGKELINTLNGKKCIAEILSQPINNVTSLKNRQSIIKILLNNKSLIKQVELLSTEMKTSESVFLEFFTKQDSSHKKIIESVYLSKYLDSLNKNTLILQIANAMTTCSHGLFAATGLTGIAVAIISLLRPDILTELKVSESIVNNFRIFSLLYISEGVLMIKASSDMFSSQNTILQSLQNKMIGVATHINNIKKLYFAAKKTPGMAENLVSLAALECLVTPSNNHSPEFNQLIALLDTNTFKGESSFFSLNGRILVAYNLMQEVKNEFADVLQAAGQLEAYCAIARKIETSASTDHPYCFTEFIESNAPHLYAHEFCNPFISAKNVVPNSIEMKADASGHVILTGPNTGGKSTLIKSLWINTLLSQTFGIAYAKEFAITPFHKLGTYLNITDNISKGISLFKAEVNRASTLRNIIQHLQPQEFMFSIMDEMFNGTNPESAQTISYNFIKQMARFKNCLFIDATHFNELKNLEAKGICKNYHMEILVDKNDASKATCTYKLQEGPSNISNAHLIAQEENIINW